ncbi:MAG: hypothetical protein P1P85_03680 [Patescibacteria group bacterium]|nr:hypothetical protein [Patescibacteria group bacterium]
MESEIDITEIENRGWFEKIKDWSYENWQTILVVLIVLIVGISAYNYNQQDNNSENDSNSVAIVDEELNESDYENDMSDIEESDQEAEIEKTDQEEAIKEDAQNNESINENENTNKIEESRVLSSSNESEKNYTIIAEKGEGITHLSRRALEKYISETKTGAELTKEQKIYAEDYIQNRTGDSKIEIGHQETFSESLISEAISNAQNLSEKSLANLKKYVK